MIVGIFVFTIGLSIGSFLNAFIWRYKNKRTLAGRSMCPECKTRIAWYDNIPLLSYILLRGKCRDCKNPISIQYPLVELATGILFFAFAIRFEKLSFLNDCLLGATSNCSFVDVSVAVLILLFLCLIAAVLILIATYDAKTKEIPNGFNLFFIIIALIYSILVNLESSSFLLDLGYLFLTAMIAFLFFYAFVFFSKETWMGGGDAKLAFGMGLFLGPINTFVAILLASWIGAIYGIGMIMISKYVKSESKIMSLKSEIPFGPFLVLGTIISFLFGSQLITWYAKIFLGI